MFKAVLQYLSGLFLLLLLWKLAAMSVDSDILIPSPETTFHRLFILIPHKKFWTAFSTTALRAIYGFGLSFAAALVLGSSAGMWPVVHRVVRPIITTLRIVPVVSIIIIGMLWFVSTLVPVFVTFLMVFPLICASIIQGMSHIDTKLVTMGKIFRLTPWQRFMHIILPALIPFLLAAAKAGLGMAWKVSIAAEVLSQPRWAVGTQLRYAQINLETAEVLAWTAAAVILGALTEILLGLVEKRFRWHVETP